MLNNENNIIKMPSDLIFDESANSDGTHLVGYLYMDPTFYQWINISKQSHLNFSNTFP